SELVDLGEDELRGNRAGLHPAQRLAGRVADRQPGRRQRQPGGRGARRRGRADEDRPQEEVGARPHRDGRRGEQDAGGRAGLAGGRATRADRWSPARSHASATNAGPEAIPPNQKYSGTSHVQTAGFIIGPWTTSSSGISPEPSAAAVAYDVSSRKRNDHLAS